MVEIRTYHSRQGQRTYITHGRHTEVLDGGFPDDSTMLRTGGYKTNYLYGN